MNSTHRELAEIIERCKQLTADMKKKGIRTKADLRDVRPGVKYNDSELRGIPLCVAIGSKEIEFDSVELKLRDGVTKVYRLSELNDRVVCAELDDYHDRLLENAKAQLTRMIREATTADELKQIILDGDMAKMAWCNETECELQIKEATGASSRNMPLGEATPSDGCTCAWCGKKARKYAFFARAY